MAATKSPKPQPQRSIPDVAELPAYQVERRQNIIDVALSLLLKREGNVEVRDVVEAADVSLASIYRYFGSKEVLLSAAFLQWRNNQYQKLREGFRAGGASGDRMHALARAFIDVYEQSPQMWDLSVATRSSRHPDIVAMRREYESQVQDWAQFVGSSPGVDQRDANAIVSILQAVFAMQMSRWRAGDIGFAEVRAALDEAIRITVDVRREWTHSGPEVRRDTVRLGANGTTKRPHAKRSGAATR
jgi:TetR/AcrR family transcriptional regulator, cholesterol catabolism regulator